MMKLNALNQLIIGTIISGIFVVLSGCAATDPADIRQADYLISNKFCVSAQNFINSKFSSDYRYWWLGKLERDCRGNRQAAIEFFNASVRMGGLGVDDLIRMGQRPPEPPRPVIIQQAPTQQQQESSNTQIIIQQQPAPAPTKRFDPFGPLKF